VTDSTAVRLEPAQSVLRLTVPARPEYLVLGRLVLTGISRSYPIEPDALGDLKLALTEACSNSMRHAYEQAEGVVDIRYDVGDGYVAVEVTDDGPGFEETAAPTDGMVELDEGGLGLAIIRAVSDGVELGKRDDGSGSRLRFFKRVGRTRQSAGRA
jgi:serine/threonine-protein kinase RsbW